jgi:hypothetical protein
MYNSLFCFLLAIFSFSQLKGVAISENDLQILAQKIWQNECGGKVEGLISWNANEEFASCGIGHFIWYPKNYQGPFDEMFPKLIKYFEDKRVTLPSWLNSSTKCPWKDKQDFQKNANSPEVKELRKLLQNTISLQALFIADRLENALPRILTTLPKDEQQIVTKRFYRVAKEPLGMYALIDYVNCKGEGILSTERYKGQGWGLLQVLQEMHDDEKTSALKEFALSAKKVLVRRVENSDPKRDEKRWLQGWYNRIDTYQAKSA